MASITLKNIPAPLYDRLRELARSHRRSLSQELIVALEAHARRPEGDREAALERIRSVRDGYEPRITEAEIQEWKNVGRP